MVVLMAAAATAEWSDDFESYSHGANLPSPWESVSSFKAYNNIGHEGSKGSRGPTTGWTYGYAYRPTDAGSNVLRARFHASSTQSYQGIAVG